MATLKKIRTKTITNICRTKTGRLTVYKSGSKFHFRPTSNRSSTWRTHHFSDPFDSLEVCLCVADAAEKMKVA